MAAQKRPMTAERINAAMAAECCHGRETRRAHKI